MTSSATSQDERIRGALVGALADLDAAAVPEALRGVAFGVAVVARLELGVVSGQALPAVPPGEPDPKGGDGTSGSTEAREDADDLDRIAAAMKLPRDTVELVYASRDGELSLVVAARMIAGDKAGATKQLTQLVAGGRQAAGLEEWTSIGTIRPIVADYGKLDSGNFAAAVTALDNIFRFTGKGASRELKVTRPGMEAIAELVQRVSGLSQ